MHYKLFEAKPNVRLCMKNVVDASDDEHIASAHMKDYIGVSNQENVAPVYFQSFSLD